MLRVLVVCLRVQHVDQFEVSFRPWLLTTERNLRPDSRTSPSRAMQLLFRGPELALSTFDRALELQTRLVRQWTECRLDLN